MSDLLNNTKQSVFATLNQINVSDMVKQKGGQTYLSWASAWAEVKKKYNDVSYEIKEFDGLPYLLDPNTGYMVFTSITIQGETHTMWLPVMDGSNKAMKHVQYSYKVKEWSNKKFTGNYVDKFVEPATMFDINKAIMRCLVKNLAMFGLGLYIYQGEDVPTIQEIDIIDIEGLSVVQVFKKYHISIVKASEILHKASGTPFDEAPNFDKMTETQKDYMAQPKVIQWLSNVAGK